MFLIRFVCGLGSSKYTFTNEMLFGFSLSFNRLRGSRVLLAGLGGLGAEVAKNLILAGVKGLTLLDHEQVHNASRLLLL